MAQPQVASGESPPPDAWDEAEEEALLARVQGAVLRDDGQADAEVRRRDAALLRDTEALIGRAMGVPGERRMLLKLDDQFEKFMGNRELQHIKINGVSEKQVTLIRAVAVLFHMRTVQSDSSISIHKTEESIVPTSRFGEPRNVAGAAARLARWAAVPALCCRHAARATRAGHARPGPDRR
jgi:hypothetical protein